MFFITLQLMQYFVYRVRHKTEQFLFTRMNGTKDGFLVHCMSTIHETVCISNFKEGVADGKKHDKDDR